MQAGLRARLHACIGLVLRSTMTAPRSRSPRGWAHECRRCMQHGMDAQSSGAPARAPGTTWRGASRTRTRAGTRTGTRTTTTTRTAATSSARSPRPGRRAPRAVCKSSLHRLRRPRHQHSSGCTRPSRPAPQSLAPLSATRSHSRGSALLSPRAGTSPACAGGRRLCGRPPRCWRRARPSAPSSATPWWRRCPPSPR